MTMDDTGDDDGEGDEVEVQDENNSEAYGVWDRQCELVEVEAQRLTRSKDYSYQACENLVLQLPLRPKARHRNMLGDSEATYVLLGMYSHSNHYGITKKSARFPHTCRYLVECIRSWKQEPVEGTSLVLSVNNKLPLHKDNHNLPGTLNHVVGLGAYQGGGIWIESKLPGTESSTSRKVLANGCEVSGRVWPTRHQVVSFSGTSWHETEAWTGERVTLALYSSRGCAVVGSEVLDELKDLGFSPPKLPQASSLIAEYEQAHVVRQNRFSKAHASSGPKERERESEREKRRERIRKQLYLLHSATGHGSKRVLLDALKRRGTSEEVLQLAREFRCSVCEERQQIHPRHLASLEVLPPKWHAISADIGHWRHPYTQEHVQFMLIIDQGSRFRVARILTKGSKQQPAAPACLHYLEEGWSQIFGQPKALRLDPAGAFRSQAVTEYCDRHGIHLDLIPADAHWSTGICEQAVQGTKELMGKIAEMDKDVSPEAALCQAIRTFNEREQIRGFTPIQHAFGRSPDATGRLGGGPQELPDELLVESDTQDFERTLQRRAAAEKALADWQAAQRLSRARNSRARPLPDFEPGELVYFWRTQDATQGRRSPGSRRGRFLGPARILAMEQRTAEDGTRRVAGAIWLVRGRNLLKCSPEQLRRASPREELLEGLAGQHGEETTPWTYNKLAAEIGGNQYEDITAETPDSEEWARAQDVEQETAPARYRVRGKRTEAPGEEEPEPADLGTSSSSRTVRPRQGPATGEQAANAWWAEVSTTSFPTENCYWAAETAAVSVEIGLPESNRGIHQMLHNMSGYFANALKRRAIEVSEKRLTEAEREEFRQAKAVEVKNFLAAEAFEALPEELKPALSQAISMRWILTWKLKDDGTTKAKARAVLLGYQDPAYEHRQTTSPVMTRQTRQLMLQASANKQWKVYKGDVSGAFLQGREYPDELYCIPCPEICRAMGLPEGSITKVRRACYGLVDAPLEWYRTVAEFLESLGFQRLWSDACAWVWRPNNELRGMISGHVDDFLFAGREDDTEWQAIIARIKEKFKWGDWDSGQFVQCGVLIVQDEEGFTLSQERYISELREIGMSSQRQRATTADTTEKERSQLRALLGAISWHAQQTGPQVSAAVGLLLSEVNHSTVQTIHRANKLLEQVRARKKQSLRIHRFPEDEELGVFGWVDAASQNRIDGGSTQGLVMGLAPMSLLRGELAKVSIIGWQSHRIDRTCRSPGAAETQAAVNGEDSVYYARYQWSEMLHGVANARNPVECVQKVPGCIITDSRNVYDKLQTEVVSIKGAEKRSNLELLSLKEAQQTTGLRVRWVHSEAQLGNSLTKAGGLKELELFFRMGSVWRIVEDASMSSARRRKVNGLNPLETQVQQQQQPQ